VTTGPRHARPVAVAFALIAAFLWALYYFFVLGTPGAQPSGLLADPFLVGGAGLLLGVAAAGGARKLKASATDLRSVPRAVFLAGMQVAVLASTYLAGAVDTALLALLADVVATPVLLRVAYGEGKGRFRRAGFVAGLGACVVGAGLVIGGGTSIRPLSGWAWIAAGATIGFVAAYFVYTARTTDAASMPATVSVATLGAGLLAIGASPFLPGGPAGLVPPDALALGLIAALGLTSFGLAPYLYFRAIERAGIVLPAVLMTGIPLFTLLVGALLFQSVPPPVSLLGVPVAVVGAVLALRAPDGDPP